MNNALLNLLEKSRISRLKRKIEKAKTEKDVLIMEKKVYKLYIRAIRRRKKELV